MSPKNHILYNGKYNATFTTEDHIYKINDRETQCVTNIMDSVLAKKKLDIFRIDTIIQYLQRKTPFISTSDLESAARMPDVILRKSGDIGTTVHSMAESYLTGLDIDTESITSPSIKRAIRGFIAWVDSTKPVTIATERIVYSESMDYVGTFDSILEIDGITYLCDLKTSNVNEEAPKGAYASYFVQLGAYAAAYMEEMASSTSPVRPIDDLMIISAKKTGVLDIIKASDIGLTVEQCVELWKGVYYTAKRLQYITNKLKG